MTYEENEFVLKHTDFINHKISITEWQSYCTIMLEKLLKANHKVLWEMQNEWA